MAAPAGAGWTIRWVREADELPGSAVVEDTPVACDDLAVLTRPGADSPRPDGCRGRGGVRELGLDIARIEEPGRLDGGDLLQAGTTASPERRSRIPLRLACTCEPA